MILIITNKIALSKKVNTFKKVVDAFGSQNPFREPQPCKRTGLAGTQFREEVLCVGSVAQVNINIALGGQIETSLNTIIFIFDNM